MKTIRNIFGFIPAIIVFVFQRADVANRTDYAEEDSIF